MQLKHVISYARWYHKACAHTYDTQHFRVPVSRCIGTLPLVHRKPLPLAHLTSLLVHSSSCPGQDNIFNAGSTRGLNTRVVQLGLLSQEGEPPAMEDKQDEAEDVDIESALEDAVGARMRVLEQLAALQA